MPQYPDQPPPPSGDDPEQVHQVYLTADVRAAIRAATTSQLRGILTAITAHLCHHLADPVGGVPPLGPDRRQPWQVCQAGTGTRAGLQIYRHVLQAVAGHYLHALGLDPGQAAAGDGYLAGTVEPFLRTARKQELRRALLDLAGCLDATAEDADIAAAASIPAGLPADVWDVGIGVSAAIGLYRRAVRVLAVHVLYFVWEGLGIGDQARVLRPLTAADIAAAYPN